MRHDDTHNDSPSGPGSERLTLSPADAAMLDRLVEAGFDLSRLDGSSDSFATSLSTDDMARAQRLLAQFAILDAYPTTAVSAMTSDDTETLIAVTMARIARADDERAARMRLDPQPVDAASRKRSFRSSDLIAVACVAILATTVIVPIMNWSRGRSLETNCANNLRLVAAGLDLYAQDFESMPMRAGFLPELASWTGYRNADNLRVLATTHYCTAGCMCCPGDADPNGTYASQAPASSEAERAPLWNQLRGGGSRIAMVADRNPLVDLERNGVTVASVALNSASHGGHGQNLLFTDGSVGFQTSPYLGDPASRMADNIWLPFGDQLTSLQRRPGIAKGSGTGMKMDVFLLQ
ncbi:MAG: hypothetical protein SGJ09_14560 [Phycisphaerae bacterium]|nr:hypothetical protein [Phycisphaerae bacterium]